MEIRQDGRRQGHSNFWLLVAASIFAVAWGGNSFTPLLVLYREQGNLSELIIDLMLVYYAVGVAGGLLAAGPLSDRYGRRPLMLLAPLLGVVGSVFIAFGEQQGLFMGVGRSFAGVAVGIAMTAGGTWIKELSDPRFDPGARPGTGAKRASMSLTAGFALGAAVAGVLAQWGPLPGQLPYAVHVLICLLLLPGLLVVPETRQSAHRKIKGSFLSDLAVPSARHPRFLLVVVVLGPWAFGSGFTAYAVLAGQLQEHVAYPVASAALIALVTLGSGFLIQQFGPRIAGGSQSRGPLIAMGVTVIGMVLAAVVVEKHHLGWSLLACVFLGLSYGLCMYLGLAEVQQIAAPRDMAGLSGYFYCLTYSGMVVPAVMTSLSDTFTYPQMIGFGAVMAFLCLLILSWSTRRC
ncbi:multidrug efflux system protein MdtL [Corynebacterium occultum]|uniref:Multidrug efflux system protein MdtL n=1 Tax=Corynebacterium occultum TaxID=2675219 RepID=A0A6B8VTD3_9CORY|nr:MFS transporter [Corynebacterium occultum]QGU06309.1 multidrug efflux system protein MdtL [Corynebacterium occultum]